MDKIVLLAELSTLKQRLSECRRLLEEVVEDMPTEGVYEQCAHITDDWLSRYNSLMEGEEDLNCRVCGCPPSTIKIGGRVGYSCSNLKCDFYRKHVSKLSWTSVIPYGTGRKEKCPACGDSPDTFSGCQVCNRQG